jgi:Lar family restriction alleviation protein
MKTKLKPCPFCGSKDINSVQWAVEASVHCHGCGANIIIPQSYKEDQLLKAIEKWNKRAK